MKYENDIEYRKAVEDEIERQAQGNEPRQADLRRDFALERLAARLDSQRSAVKGGFAVRSLLARGPLTQDIDVLIETPGWESMTKREIFNRVASHVLEHMVEEGPDRFRYILTEAAMIVDLPNDQVMARIFAQVAVADKSFASIAIDAGVKAEDIPIEQVSGRDVLAFADVKNPILSTASREYLIADKVTLFLENGVDGDRPRDLLHAGLLLEDGEYDDLKLQAWLDQFASKRGVIDRLSVPLDEPSRSQRGMIDIMCQRNGLSLDGIACFDRVYGVLDRLFGRDK